MASTDPNDRPRNGWSFVSWLNGLREAFRGNVSRQYIVSSQQPVLQGAAVPPAALAAKTRYRDSGKSGPYFSRMEEAKVKDQVWANDLRPLVEEKLRSMFHEENYKRMKLFPHVSTNLMRRVVEDISILYESPASRKLKEDKKQKQTDASKPDAIKELEKTDAADAKAETDVGGDPAASSDGSGVPADSKADPKVDDTSADQNAGGAGEGDATPVVDTGSPEVDALAQYLEIEGTDEEDETPLDKVMKLEDLDLVLDLVEKLTRVHEAVWVRPYVKYKDQEVEKIEKEGEEVAEEQVVGDPDTAKLVYLIYTPACADVIEDPDDPSRAIAWFHQGVEMTPLGEFKMVWHFYTETEYWKFDNEWRPLYMDENPLERLPAVCFRKEKPTPGSYYVEGCGRDLLEATLELCVLRSIQNSRYRDSGFKQLVITGADEEQVPADQVMGGPTPIYVPEGGNAQSVDLQPMLVEMSEINKDRADEVADGYGTKFASHKEGGAPQSGFAKKLERDKVLKENKRIRKLFVSSEKDLYNCLAVVLREYPITDVPELDPEAEVEIDFAEPSFEEDPKDQAAVDAQNLKLNKTSIIDVLKRENPDLSEIELLELAERNRQINAIFLKGDQLKLIDLLATSGTGAGSALAAQQGRPPGQMGAGGPPRAPGQANKPGAEPGKKPPFGK